MAWKRRRVNQDFSDEIEAHLQLEADRLAEEGMSRDEARAAARRAFGNVTRSRERFHESRRWTGLERLARDVRQAWRQMKDSPISTATIILSLALGIGVNTAIFSLADQALWRALPVRAPEEIVQLDWTGSFVGGGEGWGSLLPYRFYRDLRDENEVFVDMFARTTADVSLVVGDDARRAGAAMVSGSYFPTLGRAARARDVCSTTRMISSGTRIRSWFSPMTIGAAASAPTPTSSASRFG